MRQLIGILTCAIAVGAVPARVHAESTDEVLKGFFPDRDLSEAVLKIADPATGYYVVGDSLEITKDGDVRTTDARIVQVISGTGPNQGVRFSEYRAPKMRLQFVKPVRQPSDVAGNKILAIITEK